MLATVASITTDLTIAQVLFAVAVVLCVIIAAINISHKIWPTVLWALSLGTVAAGLFFFAAH